MDPKIMLDSSRGLKDDKTGLIGSAIPILGFNVAALKIMKEKFSLQEMISLWLAESASQSEIVNVSNKVVKLSKSSKEWCKNTHIYRERNGGITVTVEKIDDNIRQKEEYTYIGTIDPSYYAVALLVKFKLLDKKIEE